MKKGIWVVAKKELRGLFNEKTIVLAIVLQLFVAMFTSFLVVGLTALYNPDAVARYSNLEYGVGYVGSSSEFEQYLRQGGNLRVYRMDLSSAIAVLKERKLAAVVYVPDVSPIAQDPVKITIYTIRNDFQSTIILAQLKEVLLRYEHDVRIARASRLDIAPIAIIIPPVSGSEFFEFVFTLLIPLLLFLPAVISAGLVIDFITEEYQQKTLETLLATPLSFTDIVWGKILAAELLVPLQAGFWLVLLLLNKVAIRAPFEVLLHVSTTSFILILLSTLTALYYRDRTNAQAVFSIGLVIVMFAALSLPLNPINSVVRIATGAAGIERWILLAFSAFGAAILSAITTRYARHVERGAPHDEG